EATALFRTSALFIPFVAAVLIGEVLRTRRVVVAFMGFAGVLCILKPGFGTFQFGAFIALFGGFVNALTFVTVRHLARREHPISIVFTLMWVSTLLSAILFERSFILPSVHDIPLLLAITLIGLAAQYCLTYSYVYGEAGVVTPIGYFEIVFSA